VSGITLDGLDITPIAFTLMGILLSLSLLKFNFLEVLPLAYDHLFKFMRDPALVFDNEFRLLEVNAASCTLFDITDKQDIDKITNKNLNRLIDLISDKCDQNTILEINENQDEKSFTVGLTTLESTNRAVLGYLCVLHDVTARIRSDKQIKKLLSEKELLLQEVHHRLKNNMSVVYWILKLHSDSANEPEAKEGFNYAAGRVKSMALLYAKIYQSDKYSFGSVKEHLTLLINDIVETFPNKKDIDISLNIEDVDISINLIFYIGIIINELITNSMKYAFQRSEKGQLIVELTYSDNIITLIVQDSYKLTDNYPSDGINSLYQPVVGSKFGLKMVSDLIEQINGKLSFSRDNGTRFEITIRVPEKNKI